MHSNYGDIQAEQDQNKGCGQILARALVVIAILLCAASCEVVQHNAWPKLVPYWSAEAKEMRLIRKEQARYFDKSRDVIP